MKTIGYAKDCSSSINTWNHSCRAPFFFGIQCSNKKKKSKKESMLNTPVWLKYLLTKWILRRQHTKRQTPTVSQHDGAEEMGKHAALPEGIVILPWNFRIQPENSLYHLPISDTLYLLWKYSSDTLNVEITPVLTMMMKVLLFGRENLDLPWWLGWSHMKSRFLWDSSRPCWPSAFKGQS